jgi:signal transduction histidine kinase
MNEQVEAARTNAEANSSNSGPNLFDCLLKSAAISESSEHLEKLVCLFWGLVRQDVELSKLLEPPQSLGLPPYTCNLADGVQPCVVWRESLVRLANLSSSKPEHQCLRNLAQLLIRTRELESRFDAAVENRQLESTYQLAYGLSHELNNPLANISSRAGMLLKECRRPDHQQMLEVILDSAMRGSEMLGDLMLTARPPKFNPSWVELAKIEQTILQRATHWCSLRGLLFQQTWNVQGRAELDRELLSEILWGVLRNAIEASQQGEVIELLVSASEQTLNFQILDSGSGLSQEALKHCFDPYYCGREAGRGLGMGLTKARRLARVHGGDISIENRPAGGCQAHVWIVVDFAS